MSTVFAGVTAKSYPGHRLTDEGVDGINSIATGILGDRYPEQAPWVPIPGGEASGEWSRLVAGNNYDVPTDEQAEEIFNLLADIPQTYPTPEEWWVSHSSERGRRSGGGEVSWVESQRNEWGRVVGMGGWTVAHEMAATGNLPPDFNQWSLVDETGRTAAHVAAEGGTLPSDFDQWALADENGWTVAHVAAWWHHLPSDFNRWELANKRGRTVAHTAAEAGTLPPDFDEWHYVDDRGWTVAHVAALAGTLPPDFDQWELTDKRGRTVAQVAAFRRF